MLFFKKRSLNEIKYYPHIFFFILSHLFLTTTSYAVKNSFTLSGKDETALRLAYLRGYYDSLNRDSRHMRTKLNKLKKDLWEDSSTLPLQNKEKYASLLFLKFAYIEGSHGGSWADHDPIYLHSESIPDKNINFFLMPTPLRIAEIEPLFSKNPKKDAQRAQQEIAAVANTQWHPLIQEILTAWSEDNKSSASTSVCTSSDLIAQTWAELNQERSIQDISSVQKVLDHHAAYRKTSTSHVIEKAFTLAKGDRTVTYLPEVHVDNSQDTQSSIQNIVHLLIQSKDSLFIESSDGYDNCYSPELTPSQYWELHKNCSMPSSEKGSQNFGIIRQLFQSPSLNYTVLQKLESGPMSDAIAKAWSAKKDAVTCSSSAVYQGYKIDEAFSRIIEAASERSVVQARILDEKTQPKKHSWAMGGSKHAKEVKAELEKKGWVEIR